jgi:hypothetical protein
MTITASVLAQSRTVQNTQTTQYTSTGVTTILDKCTATNYGATAATISINLVQSGQSAASSNLVVKARRLQANETYTFPEIVGHVLNPGDFLSTLAGTAGVISLRVSGRQIS